MATTATLESPEIRLEAGGEVAVPLHIRNNGSLVEGYRIEVLGVPAQWASVEPAEVSLYPGDSTTAVVAFRPPKTSAVPAGQLPFGVRVVPTEHPTETVVPEGMVEILPFLETAAELVPRTSHGRNGGKHQLAVDNRGNTPVSVLFHGLDPKNTVRVAVAVEGMVVNPGNAAFTDVGIRPVKRLWRGSPITHPFAVDVIPHEGQTVSLDGAYVQDPTIPKWLLKALLALLILAALLVALWFFVLKPTIKSEAQDAVKKPLAAASSQAAAAQSQAAAAKQQAAAAQAAAKGKPAPSTKSGSGSSAPPAPHSVSAPFSRRLAVNTAKGADSTTSYLVPAKQRLNMTDLVFENPQGDFGTLTITRGTNVLLTLGLENFRDTDYHFVSPIVVNAGDDVTMTVHCTRPGRPVGSHPTSCNTATLLGGTTAHQSG
jgi:hypothetical protein